MPDPMDDDMELSDLGKASQDLFVSEYASHIFYVEDSDCEAFYERLFQRLFPKLSSFEVVCLGGKSKVVSKAKEQRISNLTYVFLVDKDFDDLLEFTPNSELTYLDRYSIENYLADVTAILQVLVEECSEEFTFLSAKKRCADHASFRAFLEDRLIEITRYFVVARRYALELQSTKTPVDEMLKDGNEWHPIPTKEWVAAYREKVLTLSGLSETDLDEELANALVPSTTFPDATTTQIFHVPGKHLLPCVLKYVGIRTTPNFEARAGHSLYARILNHIDLRQFKKLKSRLIDKHGDLASLA